MQLVGVRSGVVEPRLFVSEARLGQPQMLSLSSLKPGRLDDAGEPAG